jgi:transcriptional regulator with XRE-family HTH domain
MSQVAPNVGPRIRAIREQRKLSLRALAERCNLSITAISLIERGENSPTVSSLHLLATALDVKITDFFDEELDQAVVVVKQHQRIGTRSNGCIMESLGFGLRHQQLEPFMATIAPHTVSTNEPCIHPGQEFAYCIEGNVEYQVGNQCYPLTSGDSILFEATLPHCINNKSDVTVKVLLVFQANEGSPLASQHHLEP